MSAYRLYSLVRRGVGWGAGNRGHLQQKGRGVEWPVQIPVASLLGEARPPVAMVTLSSRRHVTGATSTHQRPDRRLAGKERGKALEGRGRVGRVTLGRGEASPSDFQHEKPLDLPLSAAIEKKDSKVKRLQFYYLNSLLATLSVICFLLNILSAIGAVTAQSGGHGVAVGVGYLGLKGLKWK